MLVVLALITAWLLARSQAPRRVLATASFALAAMVAQGILGYVQYFKAIPAVLVGFHVFGAVMVFAAVQQLELSVRPPASSESGGNAGGQSHIQHVCSGPMARAPCHRRCAIRSRSARSPTVCQARAMQVHLVDGTYELFRQFLAPRPGHRDKNGVEVGATRAVVSSIFTMLEGGATHLGVATDHVIESFRNDLWADYKTGDGIDPELFAQFQLLEDALEAMGVTVWAMVDLEADDALASSGASPPKIPGSSR